jgi:hypothetical protein
MRKKSKLFEGDWNEIQDSDSEEETLIGVDLHNLMDAPHV